MANVEDQAQDTGRAMKGDTKDYVDRPMDVGLTAKWALGYLNGIAKAYARGKVSPRMVTTVLGKAVQCNASPRDIADVLRESRLVWDRETGTVRSL